MSKQPVTPRTGEEARLAARVETHHPSEDWTRMCLRFVRACWGIPAEYMTAREAWENAEHKHAFVSEKAIPVGAAVFSRRRGSNDKYWHVFIACGWYKGRRLYRSTDIKAPGEVDACYLTAFTEKWGHEILGWTGDLNGYRLDFSDD